MEDMQKSQPQNLSLLKNDIFSYTGDHCLKYTYYSIIELMGMNLTEAIRDEITCNPAILQKLEDITSLSQAYLYGKLLNGVSLINGYSILPDVPELQPAFQVPYLNDNHSLKKPIIGIGPVPPPNPTIHDFVLFKKSLFSFLEEEGIVIPINKFEVFNLANLFSIPGNFFWDIEEINLINDLPNNYTVNVNLESIDGAVLNGNQLDNGLIQFPGLEANGGSPLHKFNIIIVNNNTTQEYGISQVVFAHMN